jgi:hypothetical protein
MKRRFIVMVDDATREQQNKLTAYFRSKVGFWHYFSDIWLVVESKMDWEPRSLRDEVRNLLPGKSVLVFAVESPQRWAAFGKIGMFKWLKDEWLKESPEQEPK